MANRQGRMKAIIGKYISEIVQREIKDPHLGMISINEVIVNDDYSLAKVYVTFFGAKYPLQALEQLKKHEGFVRSSLSKKMNVYKVPVIRFVYDESFDRAQRIEEALRKEEAELQALKK